MHVGQVWSIPPGCRQPDPELSQPTYRSDILVQLSRMSNRPIDIHKRVGPDKQASHLIFNQQ